LCEAEAEIDAIAYALGDRLLDGERDILPEIVCRKARFDATEASPHSLIAQALATFAVRSVRAHGTTVASIDLGMQARERFQLEQDLRQAIERNQLRVQYQPLIDAARGRVCGAEALLRWEHSERGLIPPSRFIPVAETAGLAQEIGLWVLNQAARDLRSWQFAKATDLRVAVNLTSHQLEDPDLPMLIARTLERHSVSADALEVELTESVALADGAAASVLCDQLRGQGVKIAIDDFGTGYSSFSALRTLAFDKIKIDRSFVTDVDSRRDSQAICSSIFALGRGLGIKVLAEGVETWAEYRWLRRHGCEDFQGFFFAPPLDSRTFIDFAANREALAARLSVDPSDVNQRLRA
jgi:EAL domain-containing protein (putative c-di-GMP-specific phosphodiesterase class I)